jgi:hypothetical protein
MTSLAHLASVRSLTVKVALIVVASVIGLVVLGYVALWIIVALSPHLG